MKAAIHTTVGITIEDHTAAKLVRMAEKFYTDPKNQQAFAAWQAKQRNVRKGGKRDGKK